MIVREPPHDLVALFADLDMQKLFEPLIERGQERARRCVRPIRWQSLRDPRRDTVWRETDHVLRPFFRNDARFLVVWDHHGSGADDQSAREVEGRVVDRLARCGISRERILAVAVEPELEALLIPVWERVKKIVCAERSISPPADSEILKRASKLISAKALPESPEEALRTFPKEMLEALIRIAKLRRAAPLYEKISQAISLPGLKKGHTATRIVEALRAWFPWTE